MDDIPPSDSQLRRVLGTCRTIAVVGFSARPERPSWQVAGYMHAQGYRIIPVNPGLAGQVFLGETCLPSLDAAPAELGIDMVDIFRRSEEAGPVIDAALAAPGLGALKAIWLQLGVHAPGAEARARARGLEVIADRCPRIEHERLRTGGIA